MVALTLTVWEVKFNVSEFLKTGFLDPFKKIGAKNRLIKINFFIKMVLIHHLFYNRWAIDQHTLIQSEGVLKIKLCELSRFLRPA